jgi:hypothetical protein
MKIASPPVSVERFAELVAALCAPFAVREAVLRETGLDEEAWRRLEEQWTDRLKADDALVDRYVARYQAVTQAPSPGTEAEPPAAEGPGFLNAEATPWRAEAASVGRDIAPEAPALLPAPSPEVPFAVAMPAASLRLDGTLEPEDGAALRAALPFLAGDADPHWAVSTGSARAADPSRPDATLDLTASAGSALDGTLEIGASLPRPPLLPASPVAVPGKRLHRFDPKTGEPLPIPVWVDEPTPPKKPA